MATDVEIRRTSPEDGHVAPQGTFEHTVVGGYLLEERIGVGGYGEVWKAIGPGGLPKAVKLLFGRVDGPQAESEIRSLERMRNLRHPFLLNIERIDVCDGRMIVVTELADGSLEDRFQTARSEGKRGIERQELLAYLRDAADALDFMGEQHGLQHLDVKPENLLFQGSHIKVGDFGLTKDIRETSVSIVGGFTPLYAPPELFESRPSRTSDQYSLAIVYQVMLTGSPPFSGRTAAQLTAQHLRSAPNLQELQPIDRPVIARALSKNPTQRYSSCREFVDELCKRRNSRSSAPLRNSNGSAAGGQRPGSKTKRIATGVPDSQGAAGHVVATPIQPVTSQPVESTCRPTVFVGLGGLGGSVLGALRERLGKRSAGSPGAAFPFLYIDTDERSIVEAAQGHNFPAFTSTELLSIPLKTSAEYRRSSHLEWLSRRWLFNVPRSGQVEGMRPLGRLAFVDHEVLIRQRVREAITQALSDAAVGALCEQTGLSVEAGGPEVVIVASSCGGSGSGAVLDLAYLVRDVLAECDCNSSSVSGFLLHATGTGRDLNDLQEANSVSCLQELKHFSTPGLKYSGNAITHGDIGERPPFDHTWLVHMGGQLSDRDFSRAAQGVVDYLYAGSATPARAFLADWRKGEAGRDSKSDGTCLRTFGVSRLDEETQQVARALCHATAAQWSDASRLVTRPGPVDGPVTEQINGLLSDAKLSEEHLSRLAMDVLRGEPSKQINDHFSDLWADLSQSTAVREMETAVLLREIARVADKELETPTSRLAVVFHDVRRKIAVSTQDAEIRIKEYVAANLEKSFDGQGAVESLSDVARGLDQAAMVCRRLAERIERDRCSLYASTSGNSEDSSADTIRSTCHQVYVLRVYEAAYRMVISRVRQVRDTSQHMCETLIKERLRKFRELSLDFVDTHGEAVTPLAAIPAQVVKLFSEHVQNTDGQRVVDYLNNDDRGRTVVLLMRSAVGFLLTLTASATSSLEASSKQFPANAAPELTDVGGGRRVLALTPGPLTEDWRHKLQSEFGDCVNVCETGDELTVFCEVEGIDCTAVLSQFTERNPRLVELANRVHARIDVDW